MKGSEFLTSYKMKYSVCLFLILTLLPNIVVHPCFKFFSYPRLFVCLFVHLFVCRERVLLMAGRGGGSHRPWVTQDHWKRNHWIVRDLLLVELVDVEYYRDLEIWLRGHSRSLKLVPFESLGAVSFSPSIVTIIVSVAVCEIFSVKDWCDLENRVRVRSRSLEMAPFDRLHTSSY